MNVGDYEQRKKRFDKSIEKLKGSLVALGVACRESVQKINASWVSIGRIVTQGMGTESNGRIHHGRR